MRCPFCGDTTNRVMDSRLARDESEIRRRRECQECGRRFTTRERVEAMLPKVVKRDERREEFSRPKLLQSLEKACAKRPVSVDALERLADRLEKRAQEFGETEVSSAQIGEWILSELAEVDSMAGARFASVFQRFEGIDDYQAFFRALDVALPSVGRAPEGPGSAPGESLDADDPVDEGRPDDRDS